MSWFLSVGCFAHDAHNALRWSVLTFVNDRAKTRDLWVVLQSLRNGYDQLVLQLGPWLATHLGFRDGDPIHLEALWRMAGLDGKWLDHLVELQLRWEDGKLLVKASLEQELDTSHMVTVALLHVW